MKLVNYTGPQNLEKQYNPGGTEIINLLINYTLLFLICNQHSVFFPHFSHLKKSGISGSKAGGVRARVERGGTAPRGLRGAGEKLPWHRGDPGKSRAMLSGGGLAVLRIQPPDPATNLRGKSRSCRAPADVLCRFVSRSRCTVVCFKSFRMRRLSDKTINMGKGESITIHYLP